MTLGPADFDDYGTEPAPATPAQLAVDLQDVRDPNYAWIETRADDADGEVLAGVRGSCNHLVVSDVFDTHNIAAGYVCGLCRQLLPVGFPVDTRTERTSVVENPGTGTVTVVYDVGVPDDAGTPTPV